MPWSYEYRDKPRPCYRIQDGSDDGDVAEAWDEDVAQTFVEAMNRGQAAADDCAAHITEDRGRIAELESRVAELEGVVEAIMLEYEDETPRDADVACDRMARLARAALGPKVVAKDPKPLRPRDGKEPER